MHRKKNNLRPDGILRQAEGLLDIGKEAAAFDTLDEAVLNLKRSQPWHVSLERMMIMHGQLAVAQKKNIKWALSQYRNFTSQHPESFDKVINAYLDENNKRVAEAKDELDRTISDGFSVTAETMKSSRKLEIDDEVGFSPEDQVFFVEGLGNRDPAARAKRKLLTPWIDYVWDAYRTCLDVLKNFGKLDDVYHRVASKAMDFCIKFELTLEFKKLCETLRSHLNTVEKYQGQSHAVDLSETSVLLSYVETRTKQIEAVCLLDVWNEAIYIIEDIQSLLDRVEPDLIPLETKLRFYRALALLFWNSENYLLHAYVRLLLFSLVRDEQEDERLTTDCAKEAVLAALVVSKDKVEHGEHIFLLSNLLQFSVFPDRAALISRMLHVDNPFAFLPSEYLNIFHELEFGSSPLKVSHALVALMDLMGSEKADVKYEPKLTEIAVRHILKRLSQCYQVLSLKKFTEMVPKLLPEHLERIVLSVSFVRIDHRQNMLRFLKPKLSNPMLSHQVSSLAKSLRVLPVDLYDCAKEREMICKWIREGLGEENARTLERSKIVELRKAESEKSEAQRRAEADARRQYERQQRLLQEEMSRRADAERREKERVEREEAERERKEKEMVLKDLAMDDIDREALKKHVDIDLADAEDLQKAKEVLLEQKEEERLRKQKEAFKRLDYFVRAQRLEEIPLVLKDNENRQSEDAEYFAQQVQQMQVEHKEAYEHSAREAKRLSRMEEYREVFFTKVMKMREALYEEKRVEQDLRIKEFLEKKRLQEIRQEEEKREMARLEALKKEEEEERKKQLLIEKEKEAEHLEKLERLAEIQRKRLEEIEREQAERNSVKSTFVPISLRSGTDRPFRRPESTVAPRAPIEKSRLAPLGSRNAPFEKKPDDEGTWRRNVPAKDNKSDEIPEFLRKRREMKK